VQNFAAIGPRSSEITRGEKKKPQQNLSPLPQAIAYRRTKNSKKDCSYHQDQCCSCWGVRGKD